MPPGTSTPGELTKLLIEGYSDPDATSELVGSIKAVINPETYSLNYNVQYELDKAINSPDPTQIFARVEQGNFDLELLVDGTGVVPIPGGLTVDQYIKQMGALVYEYKGSSHRPCYLKISWGTQVFKGVCKSISIKYTLFNPDGSALRAVIKLSLLESISLAMKAQLSKKSSPDLTHMRTVHAGDTLPLMTHRIYGESVHYMEVARVNGLNSIHAIKPGDELYFPPLKK